MLVRVVFKGKVTEVMINDGGTVGEALKAAEIPSVWDEGVSVCTGTPLRPGDVIEVN